MCAKRVSLESLQRVGRRPPRTHIRLGRAELELDDADLGLFDPGRTAGRSDGVLVEQDAVHELGVVDRATDFFHEADVAQVDVLGRRGDEAEDGVDGDRGQDGRVLRDDLCTRVVVVVSGLGVWPLRVLLWTRLGGETGGGGAEEVIPVREVYGGRHVLQVLDDLGCGAREGLCDDGRVDALAEQLFGGAEERAGQDDDRGGPVACFDVLCGREVDELNDSDVKSA